MQTYVIAYDLSSLHADAHTAFLKHAPTFGLSSWADCGDKMMQLPNTTVIGSFTDIGVAESAFDGALAAARHELMRPIQLVKRFVIPQSGPGLVVSDNSRPKVSLADLFRPSASPAGALTRLGSVRF